MPGANVIGFGANLRTTCSKALVGFETRTWAAANGSPKSGGTKTAEARVLRRRPRYFRLAKKLISPLVASASDAAPVTFSFGSPINSPPDMLATSCRVKDTEQLPL